MFAKELSQGKSRGPAEHSHCFGLRSLPLGRVCEASSASVLRTGWSNDEENMSPGCQSATAALFAAVGASQSALQTAHR